MSRTASRPTSLTTQVCSDDQKFSQRPRRAFWLRAKIYLITRRCSQRLFLLRPDPATNNAFLYCLIDAARRCQIDVLLPCAMSNHYHVVIYDRAGRYPEFIEHLHKLGGEGPDAGTWWRPCSKFLAKRSQRDVTRLAVILSGIRPARPKPGRHPRARSSNPARFSPRDSPAWPCN